MLSMNKTQLQLIIFFIFFGLTRELVASPVPVVSVGEKKVPHVIVSLSDISYDTAR